jgi:hypothetical protein
MFDSIIALDYALLRMIKRGAPLSGFACWLQDQHRLLDTCSDVSLIANFTFNG